MFRDYESEIKSKAYTYTSIDDLKNRTNKMKEDLEQIRRLQQLKSFTMPVVHQITLPFQLSAVLTYIKIQPANTVDLFDQEQLTPQKGTLHLLLQTVKCTTILLIFLYTIL